MYKMGQTVLDYGTKGALLAAGGALVIFTLAVTFDFMRQPPTQRLLIVLGNYFITGALLGGLVGLLVSLWQWRNSDQ